MLLTTHSKRFSVSRLQDSFCSVSIIGATDTGNGSDRDNTGIGCGHHQPGSDSGHNKTSHGSCHHQTGSGSGYHKTINGRDHHQTVISSSHQHTGSDSGHNETENGIAIIILVVAVATMGLADSVVTMRLAVVT